MKTVLCAAAIVVLAGCQTAPPQPRPTAADDPTAHCFEVIQSDERFSLLYQKTPRAVAEMTLAMTSDSSRVTDDERRVIAVYSAARQVCQEQGEQFRRAYGPPGWADEMTRFYGRYMDLISDLYAGTSTWGEFNRRRRELGNDTKAHLSAIVEQDRLDRAREDEISRQNAMNNYLLWRSTQRPIPSQALRPSLNCTTRYIAGTAYTSCQ
jgi:hypothetical protein